MRRKRTGWIAVIWAAGIFFGALLPAVGARAQAAIAPQRELAGELQLLATRAGVIFAGQVINVERRGGVVEVTFRVEEGVAGQFGATYTFREWSGLWPQGKHRYWPGERALLFLHAASAAGFSSPVDGPAGVVPVVVRGANNPPLLDTRGLDAALLRPVGTPLPSAAESAITLQDAVDLIQAARHPAVPGTRRPHAPQRIALPFRGIAAGKQGPQSFVATGREVRPEWDHELR